MSCDRRAFLLGGLGALGAAGCAGARKEARADDGQADRVDDSFARALVDAATTGAWEGLVTRLQDHPALAAMERHARLRGEAPAPGQILGGCMSAVRKRRPTGRALEVWAARKAELVRCADESARLLPEGARFGGRVFLVAGYDIGAAAPPDIVLNVTHGPFERDPEELGLYAPHEAHHVGFLARRPMPAPHGLEAPGKLLAFVRYMTQLEGMGVHAAYALRVERGLVGGDPDYAIYTDADARRKVCARYSALVRPLRKGEGATSLQVEQVLEAMSSGERLWYRVGALAAWTLEQAHGARPLIEAIDDPSAFEEQVTRLTI